MSYRSIQQVMYNYFSQFGVVAYRDVAEDDAVLPYLVYTVPATDFAEQTTIGINIYDYKSKGYSAITDVVDGIDQTLPTVLNGDNGNVTIYRGNPFVQEKNEENINGLYVNLIVETNFIK